MALTPEAAWPEIPQWDESTPLKGGGPEQPLNRQAMALGARTEWLKTSASLSPLKFADYANASNAASTLPDGQLVDAELEGARYSVVAGALRFERGIDSVFLDARVIGGLRSDAVEDQADGVRRCNEYINNLAISPKLTVVLRLPSGYIKSSAGFAFDRQAILMAEGDSTFDYIGTEYAVRLGPLGETDYQNQLHHFGIRGVTLTGATNAVHGVYVAQYVLAPVFDELHLEDFGNPNDSDSWCVFLQGHNWDIYFRNCKGVWLSKNNVNVVRANGVLVDGTPDWGNSRLNMIDSFFNQAYTDAAGVGLYLNCFKGRVIGGGFQGFKHSVQFGRYAQNPEINGTYFETIYANCESVIKIGDDGFSEVVVYSDINFQNIYANLHNENNDFGNTDCRFLTTTANVSVQEANLRCVKTLNGSKYPLMSLQNVMGQSCSVESIAHENPLLHNVNDNLFSVKNPSLNVIANSDLKFWRRGSEFSHASGVTKVAEGFSLISEVGSGAMSVYNTQLTSEQQFPGGAEGSMTLVRESVGTGYCTLRIRVGELSVLAGQYAVFSFVGLCDTAIQVTPTFVQDYGTEKSYTQFPSVAIGVGYTAKTYATRVLIPAINQARVRHTAARSYLEISLPVDVVFSLQLSCITLQAGIVRSGWLPVGYAEDQQIADRYFQIGGYNSIQTGQLKVQINLQPMRYTPNVAVNMLYQDGVVDYDPVIPLADQRRFSVQLNAAATDVAFEWVADADLV